MKVTMLYKIERLNFRQHALSLREDLFMVFRYLLIVFVVQDMMQKVLIFKVLF